MIMQELLARRLQTPGKVDAPIKALLNNRRQMLLERIDAV